MGPRHVLSYWHPLRYSCWSVGLGLCQHGKAQMWTAAVGALDQAPAGAGGSLDAFQATVINALFACRRHDAFDHAVSLVAMGDEPVAGDGREPTRWPGGW